MNDEYLAAPRSAMIIRLVEPAQFQRRIVPERRPLSIDGDVVLRECGSESIGASVGAVLSILLLVVAFSFVVTYALESFMRVL
jgi:hypothetical protein